MPRCLFQHPGDDLHERVCDYTINEGHKWSKTFASAIRDNGIREKSQAGLITQCLVGLVMQAAEKVVNEGETFLDDDFVIVSP